MSRWKDIEVDVSRMMLDVRRDVDCALHWFWSGAGENQLVQGRNP